MGKGVQTLTTQAVLPRSITLIASDDLFKLMKRSKRNGFMLGVVFCFALKVWDTKS